jgi:hypothetical protein
MPASPPERPDGTERLSERETVRQDDLFYQGDKMRSEIRKEEGRGKAAMASNKAGV